MIKKIVILFVFIFFIGCDEPSGPSPTENYISGAVNLEELSGVSTGDIWIYLVEFRGAGAVRVDSVHPQFYGEYEFIGFNFGTYGLEASTISGFNPWYYGFRDADYNRVFNSADGIPFINYGHLTRMNIPMYGEFVDTFAFEREPNDNATNAQDLGLMHLMRVDAYVSSGGFIAPDLYTGDLDLYLFESVWNGYLEIILRWSDYADLDLFLYDRYGANVVESSASQGSGPERIYETIYRGDKFIVLVASVNNPARYYLEIRIK